MRVKKKIIIIKNRRLTYLEDKKRRQAPSEQKQRPAWKQNVYRIWKTFLRGRRYYIADARSAIMALTKRKRFEREKNVKSCLGPFRTRGLRLSATSSTTLPSGTVRKHRRSKGQITLKILLLYVSISGLQKAVKMKNYRFFEFLNMTFRHDFLENIRRYDRFLVLQEMHRKPMEHFCFSEPSRCWKKRAKACWTRWVVGQKEEKKN